MRLILVGAGHAHLAVIAAAGRLRAAGIETLLIAPETFDYSGLASGVLSGALGPEAARIDVRGLARAKGILQIVSEVTAVDRSRRTLTLADGSTERYDLVSFNIGSEVPDTANWSDHVSVWPVKPLSSLLGLRAVIETALAQGGPLPALVVVGDGPTGCEIAAALAGLHERHERQPNLTLVGSDTDATWAPASARRGLLENLSRRGVRRVSQRAQDGAGSFLRLADGSSLICDHLVLATGLKAPALMRGLGLPLGEDGRLEVTPGLASCGDERVFAVGDCSTIRGFPRPFAGVFGVRAARVLIANLCAFPRQQTPAVFRPQRRWLSIIDLGDGTGLAMLGRFSWQSGLMLALKRWLDLGFVRRSRG